MQNYHRDSEGKCQTKIVIQHQHQNQTASHRAQALTKLVFAYCLSVCLHTGCLSELLDIAKDSQPSPGSWSSFYLFLWLWDVTVSKCHLTAASCLLPMERGHWHLPPHMQEGSRHWAQAAALRPAQSERVRTANLILAPSRISAMSLFLTLYGSTPRFWGETGKRKMSEEWTAVPGGTVKKWSSNKISLERWRWLRPGNRHHSFSSNIGGSWALYPNHLHTAFPPFQHFPELQRSSSPHFPCSDVTVPQWCSPPQIFLSFFAMLQNWIPNTLPNS